MANTTYDDIYTQFITNCPTDDINLPNTDEKRYTAIKSAIKYFNNRLGLSVVCDDATETVNREFSDSELLISSHYLRLSFLEGQLIHLTTTWQPFQKELGIRNYTEASRNLKELISNEKDTIEQLYISNFTDDCI